MIKSLAASKAAKLLATCVCPVAGTVALTVAVPQVRTAVHKATAPRAYAKPKTRVRPQTAALQAPCPETGPALATQSIAPFGMTPMSLPPVAFTGTDVPGTPGGGGTGGPPLVNPPGGGGGGITPPGIVPEPGTWLQLVLGFGVVGMVMRAGKGRPNENAADRDSETT